jgi:hypothetical protein
MHPKVKRVIYGQNSHTMGSEFVLPSPKQTLKQIFECKGFIWKEEEHG